MNGHNMATCFQIHDYPDWYKNLKAQKAPVFQRLNTANVTSDTPLDTEELVDTQEGNTVRFK